MARHPYRRSQSQKAARRGAGPPQAAELRPETTLLYRLMEQQYAASVGLLAKRGRTLAGQVKEHVAAHLPCGRLGRASPDT